MTKIAPSQASPHDVMAQLLEWNQGKAGRHFRSLLKRDLGKWERRVLSLLSRSHAYRNNNPAKLLELVNDLKAAHAAQITFVEKYQGELFLPGAVEMEREETEFLDKMIIPYLTRLTNEDNKSG